jgi:hypothetical protein
VSDKAKSKIEFTAPATVGAAPAVFYAVRPTRRDTQDAEIERKRVFTDMLRKRLLLNKDVDAVAREQKYWDDGREEEFRRLATELRDLTDVFQGRVQGTTKAAARAAAIRVRQLRAEMSQLDADRSALYQQTAEAAASDAEFNFLLARCIRDAAGKPVYKDVDDMLSRTDDPVFGPAFNAFLKVHLGFDKLEEARKRPENQFLLQHGYCDEELRLIDPATKTFVDADGRPVDKFGRPLNADGLPVDDRGRVVDDEGRPVGPTYPFVDDEVAHEPKKDVATGPAEPVAPVAS